MRSGDELYGSGESDSFFEGWRIESALESEQVRTEIQAWIETVRASAHGGLSGKLTIRETLCGLLEYGFTRHQILEMCRDFPSTLNYTWNRTYGTPTEPGILLRLEGYGFSRGQVIRMVSDVANILGYKWERTHGTPADPGLLLQFEEYGFTRNQVIEMLTGNGKGLSSTWERTHGTPADPGLLLQFEEYGFTQEQIRGMCIGDPRILSYSSNRVFANNEDGILFRYQQYGFTRQQIIRMCARFPKSLSVSWDRTHGTPDNPGLFLLYEEYGFTPAQIIRMCTDFPLVNYSWSSVYGTEEENGILLFLQQYGFSSDQTVQICSRLPATLGYSWDRTHGTQEDPGILLHLEQEGFSREEIIEMCVNLPSLLGYSWNRTAAQLQFAMRFNIPLSQSLFIQSIEKTVWRFRFLTSQLGMSREEASDVLFVQHSSFVRRFGNDYEPIDRENPNLNHIQTVDVPNDDGSISHEPWWLHHPIYLQFTQQIHQLEEEIAQQNGINCRPLQVQLRNLIHQRHTWVLHPRRPR